VYHFSPLSLFLQVVKVGFFLYLFKLKFLNKFFIIIILVVVLREALAKIEQMELLQQLKTQLNFYFFFSFFLSLSLILS